MCNYSGSNETVQRFLCDKMLVHVKLQFREIGSNLQIDEKQHKLKYENNRATKFGCGDIHGLLSFVLFP